jgi:hypothetical protein
MLPYLKRPVTRRRTARMMICRPRRSSRLFRRSRAENGPPAARLTFPFREPCRPRSHQSTGPDTGGEPASLVSPAPWTNAPPVDTAESERSKVFFISSLSLFLLLGYSTPRRRINVTTETRLHRTSLVNNSRGCSRTHDRHKETNAPPRDDL